jgi:hypothetical protein
MAEQRIDIRVNLTLHIREKDINYLLKQAHERGLDYGDDPGTKEIIRRLLIDSGTEGFEDLNQDPEAIKYTVHEPLLKS